MSEVWEKLLKRAMVQLSDVGITKDDWVLGGGTLLMLRYQHRLSKDVDIFLNDVQRLTMLSPRLNDAAAIEVTTYTESSNHLRLEYEDEGEIDYLLVAPAIDGEPKPENIKGIGVINTMQDREILAQKLYYRATGFTGRDLYDFATVMARNPDLVMDGELKKVGALRSNALNSRLNSDDIQSSYDRVDIHPENKDRITFQHARDSLLKWLDLPTPKRTLTFSSGPSM